MIISKNRLLISSIISIILILISILIFLISVIPSTNQLKASITPNNINRNSKNSFLIPVNSYLYTNDKIVLTLPNQIIVNPSNLKCQLVASDILYSVTAKTCELANENGNQNINIIIETNLDLINSILEISLISGITNAPSLYVEKGEIKVYDKNDNIMPSFTDSLMFNYEADVLTPGTISSSSNLAGDISNYTFSFTPKNPILKGGSILINLPYLNQNSGASTKDLKSLIYDKTTPTLINIQGIHQNSSLSIDLSLIKTYIKIINIFPNNDSPINVPITFTISGIFNPPSLDSFSGFTITTLDSRDFSIDYQLLSLQITIPMKVTLFNINFTKRIVNTNSSVMFSFKYQKFLPSDVKIKLLFPSDYPLSYSDGLVWIRGMENLNSNINFDKNTNSLTLTNPTNMYYGFDDYRHIFTLNELKNPRSTKPTGSFSLEILTNSGNLMYLFDESLTYTATPGNFSSADIILANSSISIMTDYTITFLSQSKYLKNSYLKITFPPEIVPHNYSTFSCLLISTNGQTLFANCEIVSENSKTVLYIKNAFTFDYSTNSTWSLKLKNIFNHTCASSSSSFQIESFSEENFLIDSRSTNILANFTEGDLQNIKIDPSSTVANEINIYSFSFNNKNSLDKDSYIEIRFPSDISVNENINNNSYPCEMKINNIEILTFNCELKDQIIKIRNFTESTLSENTLFLIKIPNVRNKRNLKESGLFYINTFFNPNCKLDKNYGILSVKSTISFKIKSIIVKQESNYNGDTTYYDITITPGGKIVTNDQVNFTIPSQIISSSGDSTILILGNAIVKTQILNKVDNYFTIKIESNVIDTIKFKILEVKNHYSLKPLDNFDFKILDESNDVLETYDNINNPIILNQQSNKLLNAKIESPNPSSLILTFNTFNKIPLNGIIKIKINPKVDVSLSKINCEDLSINKKENLLCDYEVFDSLIIVSNKFTENPATENEQIKFSLVNLKFISNDVNSNDSNSNTQIIVEIETFEKIISSSNEESLFGIDKISNLELALGCNTFCAKCLSNGITCTQCVSSQYILKDGKCISDCPEANPLLFEDNNNLENPINKTCVQRCPDGYYADMQEKKCIKCLLPCNDCESKTKCKNCMNGFLFYAINQTCNLKCPNRSVKSALPDNKGFICIDCKESCFTCDSTDISLCESCNSDRILYNKNCINPSDCPKSTIAYQGKCTYCEGNCYICSDNPKKCIKCLNGYNLDSDNFSCYKENEKCTFGYFLDNQKKCVLCDNRNPNCIECDGEFTCKKCNTGHSLEVNKCVKNCSEGFYFDINSLECKNCSNNCHTCSIESTNCTTCSNFSYLLDLKCVFNCPEGYFKDKKNMVCKKCKNTCALCSDEIDNIIINEENNLISLNSMEDHKCTQCINGLYLLSGLCVLKCPSSFISDDPTKRCISSRIFNLQKKYIFLEYKKILNTINNLKRLFYVFITFLIMIFFYFVKYFEPKVFYFGVCSSLISLIDYGLHIYICYLYYFHSYSFYFLICSSALCFRIILNNIFILSFNIYVRNDISHRYWISYNNISHFFSNLFIFFDFKLIRLTYSRFLKNCNFSLFDQIYTKYSRIHSIYRLFRLFDMFFVDFGILFNCSLFLYFNIKYTKLWFLTAELLLIRIIIFAYTLIDLMVNKKIDEDFYYQVKSRIDVVPRIKKFDSPYKEKYNLRIKDKLNSYNEDNFDDCSENYYTCSDKNTECTIRRSNSEINLFTELLEKNQMFKEFHEIGKEELHSVIPRDDFYLIQSLENPQRYYKRILKNYSKTGTKTIINSNGTQSKTFINFYQIKRRNSCNVKPSHNNHFNCAFSDSIKLNRKNPKDIYTKILNKKRKKNHSSNSISSKKNSLNNIIFNPDVTNTCPNFEYNLITKKDKILIDYNNKINKKYCSDFLINKKDENGNKEENNNFTEGNKLNNLFKIKEIEQKRDNSKDNNLNEKLKSNFIDCFSNNINFNEEKINIQIKHFKTNYLLFNKENDNLNRENQMKNYQDLSYLDYSDKSSNCLKI